MEARTAALSALEAAEGSVSAAQREVAGAEAGDGRDESNRSLQVGGWVGGGYQVRPVWLLSWSYSIMSERRVY